MVALAGVALAAAGTLWSTTAKRGKESALPFAGDRFHRAIGSDYEGTPGAKRYPQKLEDLLEDRCLALTRRHLRRVFLDPMTGQPDRELVRLPDGASQLAGRGHGKRHRHHGKPERGGNRNVRYVEVTNAQYFDAFLPCGATPLRRARAPTSRAGSERVSRARFAALMAVFIAAGAAPSPRRRRAPTPS